MVGCCLFSNSRSFTACFLQIVLHKQAWLTWYLRKLNNSRPHGSLQRGNKFCDCAARLFVFCSPFGARMGSRACHRGKYSGQFHFSAHFYDQQHICDQWKWCFGIWDLICWSVWFFQRSNCWCHPVWIQCCVHLCRIYDSLLCFPVVVFRFVLVFSCLVLSVFSTIPAHQDFSSYCLLILVRNWTILRQKSFFINKIAVKGPVCNIPGGSISRHGI